MKSLVKSLVKSLQSPSKRNRRCTDVGAVLLVVLIVMVALLGLGMTGLFLTSSSIQMNTNINLRNQAIVVAEAGLERARGILNDKNSTPSLPALLAGSNPGAGDDVPTSANACDGIAARGAILVDNLSAGCTAGPANVRHCTTWVRNKSPACGCAKACTATLALTL